MIHNADVPGSSPGVATRQNKGLAKASPFFVVCVGDYGSLWQGCYEENRFMALQSRCGPGCAWLACTFSVWRGLSVFSRARLQPNTLFRCLPLSLSAAVVAGDCVITRFICLANKSTAEHDAVLHHCPFPVR